MLIIVGLGNPGKEYEKTNHNIGFRVLDRVAKNLGITFEKKQVAESFVAVYGLGENRVVLAKPQTFMNNSGVAVKQLIKKYGIDPAKQLVVVADDFDTTEGTIRIREKSGNTTHNGIRSIKSEIQTNEFIRVKVSIAPRPEYLSIADFVLSKTTNPNTIKSEDLAVDAITEIAKGENLGIVMGKYSK